MTRTAAAWVLALVAVQAAKAADDIRDLRGPKTLLSQWPLAAVLAGAAVLAAAVYLGWRRLRRPPRLPDASPTEKALAGLEAARTLLASASARQFCDAVSDVVRGYLEAQFGLDAQRRTTEEFLKELSARPASPVVAHQALLAEFLQHSDVVRFSGASPGMARLEALYQAARRFVLDTSPTAHDPTPAT